MSTGGLMDKEVVICVHSGILVSYKKEVFESVLMWWVDLEPIIQSEVSQKGKDKYCILMNIYGIYNYGTNDCMYMQSEIQLYKRLELKVTG